MPTEKKDRQRFWMCYVNGSDCPHLRHYIEQDARQEAERLAKEVGEDVFVLEAKEFVRYTPPPEVEWKETIC